MSQNTFQSLLSIDVSRWVEKKGKFSYLSWSYAVAELMKHAPDATWTVVRWPLIDNPNIMVPYCQTPTGYFVEVAVTVGGKVLSQIHPVIDERNNTIANPKADQINKSIMRCLVKAIALHGLGLNVYAGEDLPLDDADAPPPPPATPAPKPDNSDVVAVVVLADAITNTMGDGDMASARKQIPEVCAKSARASAYGPALRAMVERRELGDEFNAGDAAEELAKLDDLVKRYRAKQDAQ